MDTFGELTRTGLIWSNRGSVGHSIRKKERFKEKAMGRNAVQVLVIRVPRKW